MPVVDELHGNAALTFLEPSLTQNAGCGINHAKKECRTEWRRPPLASDEIASIRFRPGSGNLGKIRENQPEKASKAYGGSEKYGTAVKHAALVISQKHAVP
jgi:hypothetical protein